MEKLIRAVIFCVRALVIGMQNLGDLAGRPSTALIVSDEMLRPDERSDVLQRMRFYVTRLAERVAFTSRLSIFDVISTRPILLIGQKRRFLQVIKRFRSNTYDVDSKSNPSEGWEWCRLSFAGVPRSFQSASYNRFVDYLTQARDLRLVKCYIFGTGPSLEQALSMDWSDGYRIVCNTIVRDKELWNHINPHFFVAADAIYHFGFTAFAQKFRADLRSRLRETNTYFVYPEAFHGLVLAEFEEFFDRLLPVPQGQHKQIHTSLKDHFALPKLGNVLNIVLLPLACTLSKNIFLWGFDGRAPSDKLFWANSSKHSYPELMDSLLAAHPAFFEHYVPVEQPTKYVAAVHGDQLENCLTTAERAGWSFVMMHKSWTPTLQRRFSDES